MKKILILNTTLQTGGAARVAHDLFKNLSSSFDAHIAYGRGKKEVEEKTFYFGNKLEFYIHVFLVRFLGLEGFGSYFSTKKLLNFIKREKFDLINIHNLHGYYLNFFTLFDFLKENNIPIIYSLHDEWPITWLPAHSLGCTHCTTGTNRCTNTYSYPKNYFPFFCTYMLKRKKKMFLEQKNISFTCPSLWLKNNVQNSFLKKFNIGTIHNGIDTEIFKPHEDKDELKIKHGLPLDKKIILFSASNLNDKSKGIQYILEAAQILQEKNYLFVGLGNGKIQNTQNIKTIKYVYDKKELSELYSLSDIFCFASRAETFLLSAAEAMSCGTPVVGFNIPVVQELVNEDVGVLTDNTPEGLSQGLDALLHDEGKRLKMGELGRKLIENTYSNEIFYKKYQDLFNDTLNRND